MRNFLLQIHIFKQTLDRFRTHLGIEVVTKFFQGFKVLLVVHQLTTFKGSHTRVNNDKAFKVKHSLNITQGDIK